MLEAPDVSIILQEGQLESQTSGENLDVVVLPQPPVAVEEPSSKAPQSLCSSWMRERSEISREEELKSLSPACVCYRGRLESSSN